MRVVCNKRPVRVGHSCRRAIAGLPFAGAVCGRAGLLFEFRLVDLSRARGASWINWGARYWCCQSYDTMESVVRDLFWHS
jgi:hypothetical protein